MNQIPIDQNSLAQNTAASNTDKTEVSGNAKQRAISSDRVRSSSATATLQNGQETAHEAKQTYDCSPVNAFQFRHHTTYIFMFTRKTPRKNVSVLGRIFLSVIEKIHTLTRGQTAPQKEGPPKHEKEPRKLLFSIWLFLWRLFP